MYASDVIDRVRTVANDDFVERRFTDSELLEWLNDGLVELCTKSPHAYVVSSEFNLVQGERQILADDVVRIFSVVANRHLGTQEVVQGRTRQPTTTIRTVSENYLDASIPNWGDVAESTTVLYAWMSNSDPKRFNVFPPNDGNGRVLVEYGSLPPRVTNVAMLTGVSDRYRPALTDYVLYRVFSEDAEMDPQNSSRSVAHREAFERGLS